MKNLIAAFYSRLSLKRQDFLNLIWLGLLALVMGQVISLKTQLTQLENNLDLLAAKTRTRIYDEQDLEIKQIGNVYVKVPREWNNIIEDHFSSPDLTVEKHFIASNGQGFAFPSPGEYAFVVGIEKRGVEQSLETYLDTTAVSSDIDQQNLAYNKINDEMFFIRRDEVGEEFFRKVDDDILVIFVYDNGDSTIDDFEQKVINSVGVVD